MQELKIILKTLKKQPQQPQQPQPVDQINHDLTLCDILYSEKELPKPQSQLDVISATPNPTTNRNKSWTTPISHLLNIPFHKSDTKYSVTNKPDHD